MEKKEVLLAVVNKENHKAIFYGTKAELNKRFTDEEVNKIETEGKNVGFAYFIEPKLLDKKIA